MNTSEYGSIVASASVNTSSNESKDPLTGLVIQAVSTVTAPSMDLERGITYTTNEMPQETYYGSQELVDILRHGYTTNTFNAVDITVKMDIAAAKRNKQEKLKEELLARQRANLLAGVDANEGITGAVVDANGALIIPDVDNEEEEGDDKEVAADDPNGKNLADLLLNSTLQTQKEGPKVKILDMKTSILPSVANNRTTAIRLGKANGIGVLPNMQMAVSKKAVGFEFPNEQNEFTKDFPDPTVIPEAVNARGEIEKEVPTVLGVVIEIKQDKDSKGLTELKKKKESDKKDKNEKRGLKFNDKVKYALGEELFKCRFEDRPSQDVVICCSFIAHHDELDARERDMAFLWLHTWDDCSRDFKMWVRKGLNMASM